MIDWNIRIGDILVIVGFAGTALVYAFKSGRITQAIETMQREIEKLQKSYEAIAGAITTVAVQKKQIERIEDDIKDMKRGVGYIQDRSATTVDREY